MKTFDWRACFNKHPVFWDLAEDELASLLDDSLSREIICQPQQVIVREGDQGDSVFLIGEGEVNVLLKGDGEPGTPIATLGPGELFGEMAVLEGRPRMATVIAGEYAVLLEIDGGPFREFLVKHPEIEFKIAAKLSERLRDLTEHVLTARFKDVDQKLELFNNRLDSELRVIDASMKATQAVFDQTNKRANEIIESAERSRGRLTMVASALGIVVTVLSLFGITQVFKMQDAIKTYAQFEEQMKNISKVSGIVEETTSKMNSLKAEVEKAKAEEKFYVMFSMDNLKPRLAAEDQFAIDRYEGLMRRNDMDISSKLFKIVQSGLLDNTKDHRGTTRDRYIDLLKISINGKYLGDWQELVSYYLMLSGMVLANNPDYRDHLRKYRSLANKYRDSDGESIKKILSREFGPEPESSFALYLDNRPLSSSDGAEKSLDEDKISLDEIWEILP